MPPLIERASRPLAVSVAGNIGSGKTTLCALLERLLGWRAYLEQPEHNPFIERFYSDMRGWALACQIWFLQSRIHHHAQMCRDLTEGVAVFDRSIFEDRLFAANLCAMSILSQTEHQAYEGMFEVCESQIPAPDLVVYLKASLPTLTKRIAKRGRLYERRIPESYLDRLNQLYTEWIFGFTLAPIVVVDVDVVDFVASRRDLEQVSETLGERLRAPMKCVQSSV